MYYYYYFFFFFFRVFCFTMKQCKASNKNLEERRCNTLSFLQQASRQPDIVAVAPRYQPPPSIPKTSSLPPLLSCLPLCSLGSLSAFISSMTIPLSKCQVTPRAKEEHYTAAPCHAGRHHPHSGFNFSAFYCRASECTFARVCMCEKSRKTTASVFFIFFFLFLRAREESANRPPVPCTRQSSISLCKVVN